MVEVRFERPKDIDKIRLLNVKAFGQPVDLNISFLKAIHRYIPNPNIS